MQPKQIDALTMSVRRNMTEKQIRDILENKFIICTVRNIQFDKLKRGFKQATVHINQWFSSSYYSYPKIQALIDCLYTHRQAKLYYDGKRYWNIKVDEDFTLNSTKICQLRSHISKLEYDLQNAYNAYNAKETECAKLASYESSPLHRTANSDETYVWHSLIRHLKENSHEYPVKKLEELYNTLKSILGNEHDEIVMDFKKAAKKRSESIKAFIGGNISAEWNSEENEIISYDDDTTIVDDDTTIVDDDTTIVDDEESILEEGEIVSENTSQKDEYFVVDEFAIVPNTEKTSLQPTEVTSRRVTRSMTRNIR